jgi:uncharacterized protein YkwD
MDYYSKNSPNRVYYLDMNIQSKICSSLLVLAIGCIFAVSPVAAGSIKSGIIVENARVRDSAGQTKIIIILAREAKVSVVGESGNWYQIVTNNGTKGWVAKELIAVSLTTVKSIEMPKSAVIKNNTVSATSSVLDAIISTNEINEYWQTKVNALRKAKGLRVLSPKKSLMSSAASWSEYLVKHNQFTHARPDGKTAQQWVANEDVVFTKRNSVNGWKKNYFTENIGRKPYVKLTAANVKAAMDEVLRRYLSEGASGVHYRSVYHPDWNGFGVSCSPIKNSSGTYTLDFVIHYGSVVS